MLGLLIHHVVVVIVHIRTNVVAELVVEVLVHAELCTIARGGELAFALDTAHKHTPMEKTLWWHVAIFVFSPASTAQHTMSFIQGVCVLRGTDPAVGGPVIFKQEVRVLLWTCMSAALFAVLDDDVWCSNCECLALQSDCRRKG